MKKQKARGKETANPEPEDDALRNERNRQFQNNAKAIAHFKEQQATMHDWISIDDVVDWRSRDKGTGVEREDYLLTALRDIDRAIRDGSFFCDDGQSRMLLTFPFVEVPQTLSEDPLKLPGKYWLSQADWHELVPAGEPDAERLKGLFTSHLQWAWIPRDACLLWAENVPFEPKPQWTVHSSPLQLPNFEVDHPHDELPPTSRQEAEQRLKIKPPDDLYDPDKLPQWSIAMVIAWIVWGDIGAVREQWDDYRAQCAEWRFVPDIDIDAKAHEAAVKRATYYEPAPNDPEITSLGGSGKWKFATWGDAGWLGLEAGCHQDEIPWKKMVDELWFAAGEGKIQATAIEYNGGERREVVEIPPHMWGRLSRTREPSGKAMLSAPDRDYRDVRFSRLDVKALWPLNGPAFDESETVSTDKDQPVSKRRNNNPRGRPKEYKWDTEIKAFVLGLVDEFGAPAENNKKLPRQEDLVIAVQDELAKKHLHPGVSTVRKYVTKWLKEL